MLFGLVLLAGATALLQVGSSISFLVVGRILQGLSAAVVWVVGLALLVDTVGPREIGLAMGWIGTSMSVAQVAAPALGGVVFDKGNYNDVFFMAYVLIGLDFAFRMLMIEKKEAKMWNDRELPPAFTAARWPTRTSLPVASGTADEKMMLSTGLRLDTSRITALPRPPPNVHSPQSPTSSVFSDTSSPSSTTDSFTCLKAVGPSRRSKLPPILTLLSSGRLLSALWATMVSAAVLASFDATIPIYLSQRFGWDSTGGGLIFLPLLLPFLLAPWIGTLVDRYGPRFFAAAGYLLAAPFLVLLRFVVDNDLATKVLLCALLILIGLCLVLMTGPLMVEVSLTVEDKKTKDPGMFGERGAYAQVR